MITVTTPVDFVPWPEDMPDGYVYVGIPAAQALMQESIDAWRAMPANLTVDFNVPLSTPRANGSTGKPFLLAGLQQVFEEVSNLLVDYPIGGLYRFNEGIWVQRGLNLPHEWGHFLDYEYRVRTGLSNVPIRINDSQLAELINIVRPSLVDGIYAKTNDIEWFAVFFDGWVTQNRRLQTIASEPSIGHDLYDYYGAGITAVRARFAALLPFPGMDLWKVYNDLPYPDTAQAIRGNTFQLHINPIGNPAPTAIRWELSTNGGAFATVAGMTGTTYELSYPTDTAMTQLTYIAYGTNTLGESTLAVFTVLPVAGTSAPTIYLFTPPALTGSAGSSATLVSAAFGSPEPAVQWQQYSPDTKVYTNVLGATSRSFTTTIPSGGLSNIYRAVFTNTQGTAFGYNCEVREPTTTLGPILGLSSGLATESSIPVSWAAKSSATGYKVEYKLTSSSTWIVFASNQPATSATFTSLQSSTSYDIRVSGYNAAGVGAVSVTLTTPTSAPASGTRVIDATGVSSAAAYGMRKLRSVYSGPCIRVLRISDNVETDLAFSGNEIDSAAYETFRHANDTQGEALFVTKWYDQSSNGADLAQSNALYWPTLVNINGKLVIQFNDDSQTLTPYLFRSSLGLYAAGATTMAAVLQPLDNGGSYNDANIINESSNVTNTAGSYQLLDLANTAADWQIRAVKSVGGSNWSNITGNLSGTPHVATYTDSGTKINTWIDGNANLSNFTATRSGTISPVQFTVGAIGVANSYGASNFYQGTMSELILWKSVLTTTQRQAVESDQKTYYGVA